MQHLGGFLVLNILLFVRVFGGGVNTGQFTKFTSLKCDEVPVCATSSPSISLAVQSPVQCTVECQSKRRFPQSYVGVNYRQQDKVCEMFSINPTSFEYNVQGCQYIQKKTATAIQCSDFENCSVNNGGCHSKAKCTSWQGVVTSCTCNVGYTGNGSICTALIMMDLVATAISGAQTVSCDVGYQLLSCGIDNSQTNHPEDWRNSIPNNPTSCTCYDNYGMMCVAWCTNAVNGFEIMSSPLLSGTFSVSCSAGKKVLGCHVHILYSPYGAERYRHHYPNADGEGCTCYDYYGAWCVASCAANIRNHEIVSTYGAGYFTVSCPAGKFVLGCGMGAMSGSIERYKTVRVTSTSANSCTCYHYFGATCYATCGQFN